MPIMELRGTPLCAIPDNNRIPLKLLFLLFKFTPKLTSFSERFSKNIFSWCSPFLRARLYLTRTYKCSKEVIIAITSCSTLTRNVIGV